MPGSTTTPGRLGTCNSVSSRIALRSENGVGTQNYESIVAQWLAYAYPCQRFVPPLAGWHA